LLGLLASSCDEGAPGFDRRQMLRELAANVILPTYRDLASRTAELRVATDALCAAPSIDGLAAARDAWRGARVPLQESWLVHFGPAMTDRIQTDLDFWPARPESIEATLATTTAITPEWVRELGVSSKGLPAIEYLLFDPARDDATLLTAYGDGGAGARRCALAAALAADAERAAAQLVSSWEHGYSAVLTDEGSHAYPMLQDAVSALYNAVFSATESIKVRKLGTPQGRESGGVPQPESAESRFADHSVDDMLAAMRAVRAMMTGDRGDRAGLGFLDAVAEIRADAVPDVIARIDTAIAALETLPRPFDEHLTDPIVETVYQAVAAVVRVMSTDVAALLGVTVTFTDNDGD
jgi:predicted lipoprotein